MSSVHKSPISLSLGNASPSGSKMLLYISLVYSVFVVYGSLVPLDFHYRSISDAWQSFQNIRYLNLGIASRADWVSNILLFIPLAFLRQGALWHRDSKALRFASSSLVLVACISLSITIEFTQLFFPPRTVSINDIIAETIGAVAGISLWWFIGQLVSGWFLSLARTHDKKSLVRKGMVAFKQVPFTGCYYGTEYMAITQVLREFNSVAISVK